METHIVVDTSWLAEHVGDADIVPVDVRPPQFFAQGHIPGAVNLPIFSLSNSASGPPAPGQVAQRLAAAGVARETHVVAYDDGESPDAAQLFWLLSYVRHPRASVLDGGITKWAHEGRDWEYADRPRAPVDYRVGQPDLSVLARVGDVRSAIEAPDAVIVDVRSPAEYLGLQWTARRNGHIPGAINIDWHGNIARGTDEVASLLSEEDLRRLYETASVTPDKRIVVYCQTGSRASETFMVLKELGYPNVASYVPGWQEWGNRQDTPVESE